jgi:hypothetical protein
MDAETDRKARAQGGRPGGRLHRTRVLTIFTGGRSLIAATIAPK